MGYNPRFWGTRTILEARHLWLSDVSPSRKLVFSTILASFRACFRVLDCFKRPDTSGSLKFGRPQHSWFRALLALSCAIKHSSSVSSMIPMARDPLYMSIEKTPKHVLSVTSGHIRGPYRAILGPGDDSRGYSHPLHDYQEILKNRSFEQFWPFLWAINHDFGVPG